MRIARAAVVVVALVACAWFALAARQAHETTAATSLLSQSSPLTPAQARQVSDDVSSASTLNPDEEPNVLRGRLQLAEGHLARARLILAGVIHREPKFLEPYLWYIRSTSNDLPAFYAAEILINRLAPGILTQH